MNKELIKDYNFKKKFGQNFLIDENILRNIVEKSNIDKDTLVLEIGVGAGFLTYYTSKEAKYVLGYEIDESLKDIISEELKGCDNTEIIFQDFLKANVKEKLKEYDYKKLYVVANLPYYITTPIITKIIDDNLGVDKIVIMVQKEVEERIFSNPGDKEYNSLIVLLNYYYDISKLMNVSRNSFFPKPNVDSIIVEFNSNKKYTVKDEELFFKLVRDSFKFKRKNLRNNLKGYDLDKIEEALNTINKDLTVRAESLTIEDFVYIANYLKEN